jgi:hypothetical protein
VCGTCSLAAFEVGAQRGGVFGNDGPEPWLHVAARGRHHRLQCGNQFVQILKVDASAKAPLRFTFSWLKDRRWEHIDYMVAVGR